MKTLEKRTADAALYDFDCSTLLASGETVSSITSLTGDKGDLTFGIPIVNTVAITYPDETIGAIGQVVQVRISGGTIPVGQTSILCPVRMVVVTSVGNTIEATGVIRLMDHASAVW